MREEEKGIVAQDAILGEDEGFELMPEIGISEGDLRGMQIQECLAQIDTIRIMVEGMIFRKRYYQSEYETEDLNRILSCLEILRGTLQ